MGKSLSITVHPSAQGAEFLTVSDAMRQVLDLVEALERAESTDSTGRQIVWRLTNARTNSPPFTVEAEAYAINPVVSVSFEASRLLAQFNDGMRELLEGAAPDWLDSNVSIPLKRALQRNLNGIGRTRVSLDEAEPFDIMPTNAKLALLAIDKLALAAEASVTDWSRTEFGALEVEVYGLARFNDKPALSVIERLSRIKIPCVLSASLAEQLGPSHRWAEAWEGRRLIVWGAQHYASDGEIKRIDAEDAEDCPWTDVPLTDLKNIDLLVGKSVTDHLDLLRGEDIG